MMTKFISSIVALILGAAMVVTTAEASPLRGKGFYYGAQNPKHLADLIDASLKKAPKGTSRLSESKCVTDASCGAPIDYFVMAKEADPEGTASLKTVADLPAFMRTLEEEPAPAGRYIVACLRPVGKSFQPVLSCLDRPFEPGEKVWINPVSKRALFASKCGNPIKGPVSPKQVCAEIHFFARPGETVARNAVGGGTAFKDDCFAIKKVGEAEFHAPWPDDCKSAHCTFAASEAFLQKKMWMLASYELEPGEYILRVPASFADKGSQYVTILCLERTKMDWPEFPAEKYTLEQRNEYAKQRDQWIAGHSDSVNVWWNAYHVNSDGIPTAIIWPTETEVPASEPVKMWWRWGVWFQQHPE